MSKITYWKCSVCGNSVTAYVHLTSIPSCGNPKAHPSKVVSMAAEKIPKGGRVLSNHLTVAEEI